MNVKSKNYLLNKQSLSAHLFSLSDRQSMAAAAPSLSSFQNSYKQAPRHQSYSKRNLSSSFSERYENDPMSAAAASSSSFSRDDERRGALRPLTKPLCNDHVNRTYNVTCGILLSLFVLGTLTLLFIFWFSTHLAPEVRPLTLLPELRLQDVPVQYHRRCTTTQNPGSSASSKLRVSARGGEDAAAPHEINNSNNSMPQTHWTTGTIILFRHPNFLNFVPVITSIPSHIGIVWNHPLLGPILLDSRRKPRYPCTIPSVIDSKRRLHAYWEPQRTFSTSTSAPASVAAHVRLGPRQQHPQHDDKRTTPKPLRHFQLNSASPPNSLPMKDEYRDGIRMSFISDTLREAIHQKSVICVRFYNGPPIDDVKMERVIFEGGWTTFENTTVGIERPLSFTEIGTHLRHILSGSPVHGRHRQNQKLVAKAKRMRKRLKETPLIQQRYDPLLFNSQPYSLAVLLAHMHSTRLYQLFSGNGAIRDITKPLSLLTSSASEKKHTKKEYSDSMQVLDEATRAMKHDTVGKSHMYSFLRRHRFCSEFIAEVLIRLGLIERMHIGRGSHVVWADQTDESAEKQGQNQRSALVLPRPTHTLLPLHFMPECVVMQYAMHKKGWSDTLHSIVTEINLR